MGDIVILLTILWSVIGSTQDWRFSYWTCVHMKANAHVFFMKLRFHSCMLLYLGKLQAYGTCVLCWIPCLLCVLPCFQAGVVCAFLNTLCIIKVKWYCYRPGVAQRVGRGIALLFHDCGTRRGWVVSSMPRPHFTPGKDLAPIFTGGWVGPRAGLDGQKISSPPGFNPGPSSL
jgi:hypothetical protein